ncbi:unnamed protein product, partial [Prorocentrum cordatum]
MNDATMSLEGCECPRKSGGGICTAEAAVRGALESSSTSLSCRSPSKGRLSRPPGASTVSAHVSWQSPLTLLISFRSSANCRHRGVAVEIGQRSSPMRLMPFSSSNLDCPKTAAGLLMCTMKPRHSLEEAALALLGGAACLCARAPGGAGPLAAAEDDAPAAGGAALGRLRARVGAPLGFAAHHGVHGFHGLCGQAEADVDYWTRRGLLLPPLAGVPSAEACRTRCFEEGGCMVWSWQGDSCFLKALEQGEHPIGKHKEGVVSGGLPCDMDSMAPYQSLFCLSLVMPSGYELDLLTMQRDRGISIFKCDDVAIYSNESFEVAPGVTTHAIDSDLKCDVGGEFGTALNLEIFMEVWKHVLKDKRFEQQMWTVKVDADAVFFPDRLRAALPHHLEQEQGVYLNNCKFGMHGPLEVFSRRAVHTWAEGMQKCQEHFLEVCSGPCNWGEDLFIDQCAGKFLEAKRDDDWTLLAEEHCVPDPRHKGEWRTCAGGQAAFHPFKTEQGYLDCMTAAQAAPSAAAAAGAPTPPGTPGCRRTERTSLSSLLPLPSSLPTPASLPPFLHPYCVPASLPLYS